MTSFNKIPTQKAGTPRKDYGPLWLQLLIEGFAGKTSINRAFLSISLFLAFI
jgi:hypothetical protein